MKIKSKISFVLLIGLIFILFTGCDEIDAPYAVNGPTGCTGCTSNFTPNPTPVRKVLVEDVTGHRCGNCPRAAETIAQMMVTYGDQVVAMGLHSSLSGSFTEIQSTDTTINPQLKYIYDFRTPTATDLDNYFGVSSIGLPGGMVNRKDFGGGKVVAYSTWPAHVANILATPPDIDLQIQNFWNTNGDSSICSFFYVRALNNLSGNYNVCLFLTEDSIVKWQKDYMASPSTDIHFYTHKHVLRAAFNGTWGLPIKSTADIVAGEVFTTGYSIKIDPAKWNINHLHVVALVYNTATYEVIQAEEQKMMP